MPGERFEGWQTVTTGTDLALAMRRYWWLVLLGLVIAFIAGFVLTPAPEFSTSFRATVLIPGDTEDPGSSERPELMVLDDLGPFTESWVFAETVAAEMGEGTTVEDVYGMIAGSRYSRIATVNVSGGDRNFVLQVAEAASAVFPGAVNSYLVAAGSSEATVQIIDPPLEPTRDHLNRWIRISAITLLGGTATAVTAILLTPEQGGRMRSTGGDHA